MEKRNYIKCDAKKCYYNTSDNLCSAEKVEIGTPGSCCSSETRCDTFVSKE